jgi:hypothetical protein
MLIINSIIGRKLQRKAAWLIFVATIAGCSRPLYVAPEFLYFTASNKNPDVSDTVTISWATRGTSQLYLGEYWVDEQRGVDHYADEGNVWPRTGLEYPQVGNMVVANSGRIVIYPPQWNRSFRLNTGILGDVDHELSIQVLPLTNDETALLKIWPDFITANELIAKHRNQEAASYLDSISISNRDEWFEIAERAINLFDTDLFSAAAKSNVKIGNPLIWDECRDSIRQIRFLLDHASEWSANSQADFDKALGSAAARCAKPEILEALLNAGADPNKTDVDGATPIYHLACNGDITEAAILFAHNIDLNVHSQFSESQLYRKLSRAVTRLWHGGLFNTGQIRRIC